jgi:hypothetical protein
MLKRYFRVLAISAVFIGAAPFGPARAQAPPSLENRSRASARQAPAASRAPRTPDGKPNFTGVWAGPGFVHVVGPGDTDTPRVSAYDAKNFTPVKPGGEFWLKRKLTGNTRTDDPTAFCLPNGLTRQILSPYAQQWIQAPGHMVILYEYMHFFRPIPIGAPNRPHDKSIEPTWMGDSIGWWDGDTFVIDTVSLKEWMFDASLDLSGGARWHSDALHVTERLRFTDPTTVSYTVTMDDPKIFTAPWSQEFGMKLHPTWKIFEFVCEENNRCQGGQCVESEGQKK